MIKTLLITFFCILLSPIRATSGGTEELARLFLEATTLREYSNVPHPILKWETAGATVATVYEPYLHVRVVNEVLPIISGVRDTIKKETGFNYIFPAKFDASNPANVFLTIGTSNELIGFSQMLEEQIGYDGYVELLRRQHRDDLPVCGIAATWSDTFEIKTVAISLDINSDVKKCVNEMFFQSMGFVNNPKGVTGSILSQSLADDELTDADLVLLRALYSKKFFAGDSPDFSDVAEIIKETLLEKN